MKTETIYKLIDAARSVEGEDRVFVGAYASSTDGVQVIQAGDKYHLAFLIGNIILQTSAAVEMNPKQFMRMVRHAFRFQFKESKGKELTEIHTIHERDLEDD